MLDCSCIECSPVRFVALLGVLTCLFMCHTAFFLELNGRQVWQLLHTFPMVLRSTQVCAAVCELDINFV